VGYRLLSLFRYWNLIQYWYPDKYLIGEDWKNVLDEFIPAFVKAKDSLQYRLVTLKLIARIHDTHANIWGTDKIMNDYYGKNYAPLYVRFIENKAVVAGYFNETLGQKSGLQRGDIIESVNGKKVEDIIKEQLPYAAASNYPTQLRGIAANLLRTADSTMHVKVNRNGQQLDHNLACVPARMLNMSCVWDNSYFRDSSYKLLNDSIGYITLGKIKNAQWPAIFEKLKNTKGIIIDIRNYPSEFVVYSAPQYLHNKETPFVKFTFGNLNYPGLFTMSDLNIKIGPKDTTHFYKGKIVILVNEITESQAEYTTMALRTTPGATVIGSTTAGADGNVSGFYLPGNIMSMFSGIGVYYPNGKQTQRIGIIPDIEVKPGIKAIKEGRDELMEKATEVINSSKKAF
jgi:C-terminal processing protease CtpA/Prc